MLLATLIGNGSLVLMGDFPKPKDATVLTWDLLHVKYVLYHYHLYFQLHFLFLRRMTACQLTLRLLLAHP